MAPPQLASHGVRENQKQTQGRVNEEAKKISKGGATLVLLPMHWLGPAPRMLGSAFVPGPGAPFSATNPRSVAQTMHRPNDKIT